MERKKNTLDRLRNSQMKTIDTYLEQVRKYSEKESEQTRLSSLIGKLDKLVDGLPLPIPFPSEIKIPRYKKGVYNPEIANEILSQTRTKRSSLAMNVLEIDPSTFSRLLNRERSDPPKEGANAYRLFLGWLAERGYDPFNLQNS